MENTQDRKCYTIRFKTSRQKDWEDGRIVVNSWWGTIDEMDAVARGILCGLHAIGGYKSGKCSIYEVSDSQEKIMYSISF